MNSPAAKLSKLSINPPETMDVPQMPGAMPIKVDADDEDEQEVERMSSPGHTAGHKRGHDEIDEDDTDSGPEPKRPRANSNASQAGTICTSPSMKDEHEDVGQRKKSDDEVEVEEAEEREEEEEEEEEKEEKKDVIKPTNDTTAKLKSHIANLDGLVAQERSRANKLQKRYDSLLQSAQELDISNKMMSSQLREAQAEINRLRAERSTLALLNPQSDKTEEECLRSLKRLNQKIKDLSNHIAASSSSYTNAQSTQKERREEWQSILVDVLRRVVFDKFLAGLSKRSDDMLQELASKVPAQQYGLWRSVTTKAIDLSETLKKDDAEIRAEVVKAIGRQRCADIPKEILPLLDAVTDLAVEVQWHIVKDSKDVTILSILEGESFDPAAMEDARGRVQPQDELDTLSVNRDDEAQVRSVKRCISFGFAGSDGIEAKCLVVLAD